MRVHALYSLPHYREHLEAIHRHVPDQYRGELRQMRKVQRDLPAEDIVMLAGYADLASIPFNRVILVEHGAGQRYLGLKPDVQPFYGGPYPDNVIAYLGPRQAAVDSVGLPGFAMHAPVCDPYEIVRSEMVCAITWHWNAHRVCPEAGSAIQHYIERLPDIVAALRAAGYQVLGHRHPRMRSRLDMYQRLGIPEVDVDTVRRRASLLIADNTSLLYEMSYLNRKTISLNAPWYRRDVEHGLRFWEAVPGVQVDDPDELIDVIGDLKTAFYSAYPRYAAEAAYDRSFSSGRDGLLAAAWVTSFVAAL